MNLEDGATHPNPMRATVRIRISAFRTQPAILRLEDCTLTCETDGTQLFSVTPETAELYWPSLLHLRFGQGTFQVQTREQTWRIVLEVGNQPGQAMGAMKLAKEWRQSLRQHGFCDL